MSWIPLLNLKIVKVPWILWAAQIWDMTITLTLGSTTGYRRSTTISEDKLPWGLRTYRIVWKKLWRITSCSKLKHCSQKLASEMRKRRSYGWRYSLKKMKCRDRKERGMKNKGNCWDKSIFHSRNLRRWRKGWESNLLISPSFNEKEILLSPNSSLWLVRRKKLLNLRRRTILGR